MSEYHALNEAEAIELAKSIPGLFPSDVGLLCQEIGDGNLNLVFRVLDPQSHKGVIMKQALPYAKVVGESWPLTLDRARIEHDALQIQARLCPDLVPKLYSYRADLALTIMEDLSDHVIMRKGLTEGHVYPEFANHISEFMARTLFFTSDLGMNQQDKKMQVKQFINPELCKITEELIFEHPYKNAETNNFNPALQDVVNSIWEDKKLHFEVSLLRESFLTHAQALLHGDLHTGSIFVTSNSTKVIDPEFAFYGPIGFDVGAVIANILLNYAGQEGWILDRPSRKDYRSYLEQTLQDVWNRFENHFLNLWNENLVDSMFASSDYKDRYMRRLLQDTIGFAGCKMIRRVIGLAHVSDIDSIKDPENKVRAERLALSIGTKLVKHHRKAASISEVINIVHEAVQ